MGEKKLLYYIFIITVASVSLILYFITLPQIKNVDSSKNGLQNKKTELLELQNKEEDLKSLELSYKDYQDKINTIAKMFPKSKEVSDYVTQIETAITRSKVTLKSIKIPEQQAGKEAPTGQTQLIKNGDIFELPMDIIIISEDYDRILNFVQTLEKLSRFTSIKKTTIKANENRTLEVSISLNIYVLP